MKYIRLGMSESTLLFLYWLQQDDLRVLEFLKQSNLPFSKIKEMEDNKICHLMTISGYYDKSINQTGAYEVWIPHIQEIRDSKCYQTYLKSLLAYTNNSSRIELNIDFGLHSLQIVNDFKTYLGCFSIYPDMYEIHNLLKDKKVLFVGAFSQLIKSQIESGNLKQIYPEFPDVEQVLIYRTPYTFFNEGYDDNIFGTTHVITSEIPKNNWDVAIISCGAYSCLIADSLQKKCPNKFIITLGGHIQDYFGILSNRMLEKHKWDQDKTFESPPWISVPESYRPQNWNILEGGCYW